MTFKSTVGGFVKNIKNGLEHPPFGKSMLEGIVIVTGMLVTFMLLFVVIL